MSLIIDANRAGDFTPPLNAHASEILVLIAKKKIRICVGGKLLKELAATKLRSLLVEWVRSGRLHKIDDFEVERETTRFEKLPILSDDPHVLGLASAARCRLLYTEDGPLIKDFKNVSHLNPKGKIISLKTKTEVAHALFRRYGY